MVPWSASQSRAAASTSACSTVCRSNVDRLITLSTSAVAGRSFSVSRRSLGARGLLGEQTGFFNCDPRLRREVLHQLDLLVAERTPLLAIDIDGADDLPFFQHGDRHQRPRARLVDELDDARILREIGLIRPQ